jgi:hypothetical protein
MLPGLLPLLFCGVRFIAFPLSTETLHEPKLCPPIPWILRQIRSIDCFRLAGLTDSE